SKLAGDDREAPCDPGEDSAAPPIAGVEVVGVVGGDEGFRRIWRQVLEPATQVLGPVEPAEHDRLPGPGRTHDLDQLPHPDRPVRAEPFVRDLAAPGPAIPTDV